MINEFRVTIRIKAPINKVWNELVTWSNQGNWMALTKVESSDLGPDDSGIGTTIEAFTGIGKFGVLDLMRVTDWQPPNFCRVDHYGKIIKGIGEFKLTQEGDETRFDWYEEILAPKAILFIVKPFILFAVFLSLRKFAGSIN
ncbi:MAG: SRPBCC family protein [Actinomycetales bacterium]